MIIGPFESIDRIRCSHFLTQIISFIDNSVTEEVPSISKLALVFNNLWLCPLVVDAGAFKINWLLRLLQISYY